MSGAPRRRCALRPEMGPHEIVAVGVQAHPDAVLSGLQFRLEPDDQVPVAVGQGMVEPDQVGRLLLRKAEDPVIHHQQCAPLDDKEIRVGVHDFPVLVEVAARKVVPENNLPLRVRRGLRQLAYPGHGDVQGSPVLGTEILAAAGLRYADELTLGLLVDIESDRMDANIDAGLPEFGRDRARVAAAGLDAVGDQHDRAAGPPGTEQDVAARLERARQRRSPARRDAVDQFAKAASRPGADIGQQLDIVAVARVAMAESHKPEIHVRVECAERLVERIPRGLDLGDAVDLAPHGVRGVEDEQDIVAGLRRVCEGKRAGEENRRENRSLVHEPLPLSALLLLVGLDEPAHFSGWAPLVASSRHPVRHGLPARE